MNRWLALVVASTLLAAVGCESNPFLRKYGMNSLEQKDRDKAEKYFAKAVDQDATDWKSLYYLGKIRLEQGRLPESQLMLERSFALRRDHPETPDILDALAETLYQAKRSEELHTLLEQAVGDYGSSRDYIRHARYLREMGDVDRAKLAYRKGAYFAQPGDAYPFVVLADFYEELGDKTNAVTALRHAHSIKPKDPVLKERLRNYGFVPGPTAALPVDQQERPRR